MLKVYGEVLGVKGYGVMLKAYGEVLGVKGIRGSTRC